MTFDFVKSIIAVHTGMNAWKYCYAFRVSLNVSLYMFAYAYAILCRLFRSLLTTRPSEIQRTEEEPQLMTSNWCSQHRCLLSSPFSLSFSTCPCAPHRSYSERSPNSLNFYVGNFTLSLRKHEYSRWIVLWKSSRARKPVTILWGK